MSVVRLGSGAPWEGIVGYSRVVVRGESAWVSGTTSLVDGRVAHVGDAAAQTRQVLVIIEPWPKMQRLPHCHGSAAVSLEAT